MNHDGTSAHGKYTVSATSAGAPDGLANLTVTRASDHEVVLTTQTAFWGFSPDEDRFVTHSVLGSVHNIQLYDLAGTPPLAAIWTSAVATSSDRIQFSPSGRYLFYAVIASTGQTQLNLVEARTGTVRYADAFTPVTVGGTPDDEFGVAGWGFGPDDSRFVYAWTAGASNVNWNLVNLERPGSAPVRGIAILDDIAAWWQFSPCGDVIGLVQQHNENFVDVSVFNTADGTSAGSGASIATPVQLLSLHATASSHVATNNLASGSTDFTLGPNNAGASCGGGTTSTTGSTTTVANQSPAAQFTPPATAQAGFDVSFHDASTDPDGTISSRAWNFGDGQTSTDRDPTHMYTDPAGGTYTVSLTVTDDGGATATTSHQLVVGANAPPHASFTYFPDPPARGDTVTFTDTSSDDDGILQQSWYLQNGYFGGPTASVKVCEPFDAQLTVSDHLYQSDTATVSIVVSTSGQIIPVVSGQSLADAVAGACPGDTISLGPGTYDGGVTLDGVDLEGAGAGSSVVSGAIDPAADGWVLSIRGDRDVAISDLSVRDGRGGISADNRRSLTTLDHVEVDHNSGFTGVFVDCCDTDLLVESSHIHHNQATEQFSDQLGGGGIAMFCCGEVTVNDSEISFNSSDGDGGGAEPYEADGVVFTGNFVHDNVAAGEGGGLLVDSSGHGDVISNNRFVRNTAATAGALSVKRRVFVGGNLIAHNDGGGLRTSGSGSTVIVNATIVDNVGSGVENTNTNNDVRIYNSIVAGNTANVLASSVCGVTSNLIGSRPAFADSDYHLASGSIAIDAGVNAYVPTELATDADGDARIQDGDGNGTETVDLGYDELMGAGGGSAGAGSLPVACDTSGPAPANDAFANAQELSGDAGTANGSTVGATAESGEPDHAESVASHSVWYAITPGAGSLTLATLGSSFDTVLGLYTGADVSHLTEIASNDDADPDNAVYQSSLTFESVAGTTYWIAVDGYYDGSSGESGDVVLTWTFVPSSGGGGGNHPPVVDSVAITPASATTDEVLSAGVTGHDPEGDPVTFAYQWSRNGLPIAGATGASLDLAVADHGDKGDSIAVQVIANDGALSSAAVASAALVVANSAPACSDLVLTVDEGSAGDVVPVCVDADHDLLTYVVTSPAAHGTASVAVGQLHYVPDALYSGADTFAYTAADGTAMSSARTVAVTVNHVNHAPIIDSVSVAPSGARTNDVVSATVVAHDVDGDAFSYAYQWSRNGLAIAGATGASLNLATADNGDKGDSIVVQVIAHDDALASAAVMSSPLTVANTAPTCTAVTLVTVENVAGEASPSCADVDGDALTYSIGAGASHGTASIVAARLHYLPSTGFSGSDTFTYRASDGVAASPLAAVAVTVDPVNSAPHAVADAGFSTEADLPLAIPTSALLANDTDPDGDTLVVVSLAETAATHGSVELDPVLGQVIYTPDPGYVGAASFSYTITDPAGLASTATVSLTVTAAAATVCRVTGNGQTSANDRFGIGTRLDVRHGSKGFVHYRNRTVRFVSASITDITCVGKRATIVGTGKAGGARVTFTLVVTDGAPDSFALSWPGFSVAGPVTHGKLKITTKP